MASQAKSLVANCSQRYPLVATGSLIKYNTNLEPVSKYCSSLIAQTAGRHFRIKRHLYVLGILQLLPRSCNYKAALEPLLPKVACCIPVLLPRYIGKCTARVLKRSAQPNENRALVCFIACFDRCTILKSKTPTRFFFIFPDRRHKSIKEMPFLVQNFQNDHAS